MNLGQKVNKVKTQESRQADLVCMHYAQRPELIERMLRFMGAQHVKVYGNEIRCTCPIHRGNNPEGFVVWIDKGTAIWRCYTDCQMSGTIIRLVMKKYPKASFVQAIQWASQFAGLAFDASGIQVSRRTLDEDELSAFKRQMGIGTGRDDVMNVFPEQMIYDSMNWLYDHRYGALAQDFLTGTKGHLTPFGEKKKQFSWDVLHHFQVGFVPAKTWVWFDPKEERNVGWFEDRISIPWRNMQGQCVGFGGRRLDGNKERKFKNLPGTSRALTLYGLSDPYCQAALKQRRIGHAFEGYSDVWRAHQYRCYASFALGGVDLTRQQLELIASQMEAVVLCFDGDLPGLTAANKYAKQLMKVVQVYLATYPPGTDPDDQVDETGFWQPIVRCQRFVPKE